MIRGTRRFLDGMRREFNPREPFIKEAASRNLNNLWTKRELGGKGKIAVGASAVGYGVYAFDNAPSVLIENEARMQDPQQLPGTRGDMQEYTPHYSDYTGVEADGNLVFALHNLRHGG